MLQAAFGPTLERKMEALGWRCQVGRISHREPGGWVRVWGSAERLLCRTGAGCVDRLWWPRV